MESRWYLEEQGFPGSKHRKKCSKMLQKEDIYEQLDFGFERPSIGKKLFVKSPSVIVLEKWKGRRMATQTSLAMAGARVAGIPPVNVPGLINPPVRKKGFIGAISSSGWFVHFSLNKLLTQESFNLVPLYNGWQKKQQQKDGILYSSSLFFGSIGLYSQKRCGFVGSSTKSYLFRAA